MKKILAMLCLTAVVLAGCGKPETDSSSAKEPETATAAETTAAAETTETADTIAEVTTAEVTTAAETTTEPGGNVSAGGLMDMYPAIYEGFIQSEFDRIASENDGLASIEFAFRDLDVDGIPELIFKRGTCEADYQVNVFTLDSEGNIKDCGLIGGGHTAFGYDENTGRLVMIWGHMGAADIEYLEWDNGTVKSVDNYEFTLDENTPSYDTVLEEKGIKYMDHVSAYQSDYETGATSWFCHSDGTIDEKEGLYLDYMG
jgi:hypothetical protein